MNTGIFLSKENVTQVEKIIAQQYYNFLHSLETHGLDFTSGHEGEELLIGRVPVRVLLKRIVDAGIGFYIRPEADLHFATARLTKIKRTLGVEWSKENQIKLEEKG